MLATLPCDVLGDIICKQLDPIDVASLANASANLASALQPILASLECDRFFGLISDILVAYLNVRDYTFNGYVRVIVNDYRFTISRSLFRGKHKNDDPIFDIYITLLDMADINDIIEWMKSTVVTFYGPVPNNYDIEVVDVHVLRNELYKVYAATHPAKRTLYKELYDRVRLYDIKRKIDMYMYLSTYMSAQTQTRLMELWDLDCEITALMTHRVIDHGGNRKPPIPDTYVFDIDIRNRKKELNDYTKEHPYAPIVSPGDIMQFIQKNFKLLSWW